MRQACAWRSGSQATSHPWPASGGTSSMSTFTPKVPSRPICQVFGSMPLVVVVAGDVASRDVHEAGLGIEGHRLPAMRAERARPDQRLTAFVACVGRLHRAPARQVDAAPPRSPWRISRAESSLPVSRSRRRKSRSSPHAAAPCAVWPSMTSVAKHHVHVGVEVPGIRRESSGSARRSVRYRHRARQPTRETDCRRRRDCESCGSRARRYRCRDRRD